MRPPSQPSRPPTESVMVDFIGIERIQELVARRGVARFIEELAGEIETDFLRWGAFEKSPRHATHSPLGVIELMPASDGRLYAFKYVNGHPKNTAVGLLTVTAFGVLADVQTGYPLLPPELPLTTALRTAATSALAARRMARPDARVVVEYEPQSRIEGEIQQMNAAFPVIELATLLAGQVSGRVSDRDVTIFDSVGFALEDFSSLRYLLRIHHEERGTQQQIDLLPDLEDPKDLFALLLPEPRKLTARPGGAAGAPPPRRPPPPGPRTPGRRARGRPSGAER